jgi:hypothetical protein
MQVNSIRNIPYAKFAVLQYAGFGFSLQGRLLQSEANAQEFTIVSYFYLQGRQELSGSRPLVHMDVERANNRVR